MSFHAAGAEVVKAAPDADQSRVDDASIVLAAQQAQWSLVLDADLYTIIAGNRFRTVIERAKVDYEVDVWVGGGESSADGCVVRVFGESRLVARAKMRLCDALVCICAEDASAPVPEQAQLPQQHAASIAPCFESTMPPAAAEWVQAPYAGAMPQYAAPWAPGAAGASMMPHVGVHQCASLMLPPASVAPFGDAPYGSPVSEYGGSPMMAYCDQGALRGYYPQQTDDLVHFEQQIPHSLVGLIIGVKGASIHAVELVSGCHLSLDRGYVAADPETGVPFVVLHIHGLRSGAMQAATMVAQILQRHIGTMHAEHAAASTVAPPAAQAPPARRLITSAPALSTEHTLGNDAPGDGSTVCQQDAVCLVAGDKNDGVVTPERSPEALQLLPTTPLPEPAARHAQRRRRLSAPPSSSSETSPVASPA